MLSGVVMKLLEKHPDNRYQSAWGAMFDFRKCLVCVDQTNIEQLLEDDFHMFWIQI